MAAFIIISAKPRKTLNLDACVGVSVSVLHDYLLGCGWTPLVLATYPAAWVNSHLRTTIICNTKQQDTSFHILNYGIEIVSEIWVKPKAYEPSKFIIHQ